MDENRKITKKIRVFIAACKRTEKLADKQNEDQLWLRIAGSISERKARKAFRKRFRNMAAIACITLLVVGISVYLITAGNRDSIHKSEMYAKLLGNAEAEIGTDEIILILNTDEKIAVDDEGSVEYTTEGEIVIDSKEDIKKKVFSKAQEYNTVIVPKGKMMKLNLEDGTRLHVNAGSKVIYPVPFDGKKREIFVEGEVYAEVSTNPKRPFIVNAPGFAVEVTGTVFNINAYKEDLTADVVLVDGSVNVKSMDTGKKVLLKPNQMVSLLNGTPQDLKVVNAEDYICWIDRILIFRSAELSEVFRKLSRHYGIEFNFDSPETAKLHLTGKLDLKDDFERVMKNVSFATDIKYKSDSDGIKIYVE